MKPSKEELYPTCSVEEMYPRVSESSPLRMPIVDELRPACCMDEMYPFLLVFFYSLA
jgi:hypothetical protein